MLIVIFDGRLSGSRGDRKGEGGTEVDARLFSGPARTLRLRFLTFRGRFGGDGDRGDVSPYVSSTDFIDGERGVHPLQGFLSRNRGAYGSGFIVTKV